MPSLNEILLVAVILVGILFVPRLMSRKIAPEPKRPLKSFSRRMRVAVAVSIVFPVVLAGFLQPWRGDAVQFLYIGLGPVALGWLVYWVLADRKK